MGRANLENLVGRADSNAFGPVDVSDNPRTRAESLNRSTDARANCYRAIDD